jgi:hypothetical protein
MSVVDKLSQNAIPKDDALRFQNGTLNVGRSELVTNCGRFNGEISNKQPLTSQLVISNHRSLRSHIVTLDGFFGVR